MAPVRVQTSAGLDIVIPPGMKINCSLDATMKTSNVSTKPEVYDNQRFVGESKKNMEPKKTYAFCSFGGLFQLLQHLLALLRWTNHNYFTYIAGYRACPESKCGKKIEMMRAQRTWPTYPNSCIYIYNRDMAEIVGILDGTSPRIV